MNGNKMKKYLLSKQQSQSAQVTYSHQPGPQRPILAQAKTLTTHPYPSVWRRSSSPYGGGSPRGMMAAQAMNARVLGVGWEERGK